MSQFSSNIFRILLIVGCTMYSTMMHSQIQITNEAQLRAISEDLNGSYILTEDIVLSQEWTPIGAESAFRGTLDGGEYIIYNLKITNASGNTLGLFAKTNGATIKNLGVDNAEILGGTGITAGIFVGEATKTTITNSYIANTNIECSGNVGSFVGRTNDTGSSRSSITDCFSTATISSVSDYVGGIIGTSKNTDIANVYFSGTIDAASSTALGGIISFSDGGNTIVNSLTLSPWLRGVTVGRIVGRRAGSLTLNNNYARADLLYGKGDFRTMGTVPYSDSYIRGIQGESIPYEFIQEPEYTTAFPRYTEADITTAYDAFNDRFLMPKNVYVEKVGQSKVAAIWVQAIYFDVAMNAYKRTGSAESKQLMDDLYLGNFNQYAQYNWDNGPVWFIYDDIMWWVISLARAYELTGDEKYLERSETGFERVWSGSPVVGDKGSYDPGRGGMYWAWNNNNPPLVDPGMGKMACINYPTVVAAMTLYNATQNEDYLNKAKEIYDWSMINLFDPETGRVPDSNHNGGISNWTTLVYNQGTCIGAAMMLYKETGDVKYLDDAILTANYTKNQMSYDGAMPFQNGIEQGIYTAIFSQYIIRLIEDGKQYQYLPWLWYNIDSAWGNRNKNLNITDKNHVKPARGLYDIESYDASGTPALMQVIPPSIDADIEAHCKNRAFYENNLRWDVDGVWKLSDSGLPMLQYTTSIITKIPETLIDKETAFKAYKSDGMLVVELEKPSVVEVFNSMGGVVRKLCVKESFQQFALPHGSYIVRATLNGKPVAKKVII